jgi:hypothetical protein
MDDGTKRLVLTLTGFAAGIGPVLLGIGFLTKGIEGLTLAMTRNPYTAVAIGILAIGTAAYIALNGISELDSELAKKAGVTTVTGTQDERNRLIKLRDEINANKDATEALIKAGVTPQEGSYLIGQIALYREQIVQINETIKKSNDLSSQKQALAKSAKEAAEEAERLKNLLGGTTTELVAQAGSIGALSKELEGLQAQFEATASGTERSKFADKIRELEERITILRSVLKPVITELKMLNEMGMAGDIGFAGEEFDSKYEGLPMVTAQMKLLADASFFANQMALEFTNSFSAGLANLLVHGGKIEHMLRNIGNLLASSALQLGIQMLLMGATGSGGAFGYIKGLIGGLFAPSASMGDMGGVTPASASLTLDGQFQIRGTDLVYVMNRAERSLR